MGLSIHRLTQTPRPYGVAKKCLIRDRRFASAAVTRKAIDGRPPNNSNVQNTFLPARKLGWPHDEVSRDSGNARHNCRSRLNTGLSNACGSMSAFVSLSTADGV